MKYLVLISELIAAQTGKFAVIMDIPIHITGTFGIQAMRPQFH